MLLLQLLKKTDTTKKISGILLGFGLACIFNKVCKGRECIIVYKNPREEITRTKNNDKCYNFKKKNVDCDK